MDGFGWKVREVNFVRQQKRLWTGPPGEEFHPVPQRKICHKDVCAQDDHPDHDNQRRLPELPPVGPRGLLELADRFGPALTDCREGIGHII